MANVWNAQLGRWEDPETGNVLVGGQGMPDGTWQGGVWQNPQGQQLVNGQWVAPGQQTAPIGTNPTTSQYNAQQGVYNAQGQQIAANQGVTAAQAAVLPKTQAQIDAERASNTAGIGVVNARAGTIPAQQAVIDAKGNVITAQSGYTMAQQGFITQQQTANTARIGDANAIVQARGNTADQVAVARQQQEYADIYDKRARAAGVSAPIRIATAGNEAGPLAPGVIGDVRTQEARVSETAQDRETQRALQLEGARLAVSLIGTNVQLAEQAAARVGLTLDQAQLAVQQAENTKSLADIAASNAGLDVKQAGIGVSAAQIGASTARNNLDLAELDLRRSEMPPSAGMVPVIDPTTGIATSWGTPQQAEQARTQFNRNNNIANAATRYSESGLGGLSDGAVLQLMAAGVISEGMAYQELLNRIKSPTQVQYLIEGARPKKSGSDYNEADLKPPGADVGSAIANVGRALATPLATSLPSGAAGSPAYQAALDALTGN